MPRRKSLPKATPKEQRMYEHIKRGAQKTRRYGKRAKQVAARTVRKYQKSRGSKSKRK